MDEVDNTMFVIPTSSLVSKVAGSYEKQPVAAPVATVAPSNTKTVESTAVSPAPIDVSPKNPQNVNIQSADQIDGLAYDLIYRELSSASEEVIECRKNRLSNVF